MNTFATSVRHCMLESLCSLLISLLICFLTGNGTPLPLFEVPSTCGYNVHRKAFVLVMSVPYDGCYVAQEVRADVAQMSCLSLNLQKESYNCKFVLKLVFTT